MSNEVPTAPDGAIPSSPQPAERPNPEAPPKPSHYGTAFDAEVAAMDFDRELAAMPTLDEEVRRELAGENGEANADDPDEPCEDDEREVHAYDDATDLPDGTDREAYDA